MKFKAFFIFLAAAVIFAPPLFAKKKIVRHQAAAAVKHQLRSDHQALLLVLSDLDKAAAVNYKLTYTADGIPQGIDATYDAASGSAQKELVFGTCSKNVCNYHKNIKDMVLELRTLLKTGKTLVQKYSVKP